MKIGFDAVLQKFDSMGEKTGWTYIELPIKVTDKLKPGVKKSYRVKGKLDDHHIKAVALVPIGNGAFIIAVNATMRKAIRKTKGQIVSVLLEIDEDELPISPDLLECLQDEPAALKRFTAMPPSHQHYYSKWIESAKTEGTKAKRIAMAVSALVRNLDYGAMLREERDKKFIR